ncbi:hypothetical protein [Enhygromyxa salina]|uniref:Uncharacterized protein n=1 Tax=Enhygromyxa salina TaxID=215803 RepID=A0A2S9XT26_9BACT|nr:hypothetical protein [Enhygromyxa salina]PRP96028.1 hypothetical protein ENSA7_68420 [Enhygromyxa salina]
MRRGGWVVLLCSCLGCGDSGADDGSGMGTAETGAEEGGGADAGADPGPDGPGCDEPWEGWWAGAQADDDGVAQAMQLLPEASAQRGRWHAAAAIDAPVASGSTPGEAEQLRATLISEAAALSTGRSLAVSWCLGNIFPNPQGLFGVIDEEHDAINLERYTLFRKELERATRIWERHSRMNFVHLVPLDDRRKPSGGVCDTALEEVWFRAQTPGCDIMWQGSTNAGGENEFDPEVGSPQNPGGYDRVLCIAHQFLDAAKKQIPYRAGHEAGHILGLAHEYVRWDQGDNPPNSCRDNHPFEPVAPERQLTPEDPWSVMGYDECEGSEKSTGISPHDMMGAYYAFNWADRRVRDMAPQGGGQDRRLWAGNLRPGLLWYAPFPDRLIEWRFAAQQPGPLAYDVIERCMGGAPPCAVHDSNGHWRPIMGQFTGWSDALDVFMYSPDQADDVLLRNRANEGATTRWGSRRSTRPRPIGRSRWSETSSVKVAGATSCCGTGRGWRAITCGASTRAGGTRCWMWMLISVTIGSRSWVTFAAGRTRRTSSGSSRARRRWIRGSSGRWFQSRSRGRSPWRHSVSLPVPSTCRSWVTLTGMAERTCFGMRRGRRPTGCG